MPKLAIIYSTKTGNTEKIANSILSVNEDAKYIDASDFKESDLDDITHIIIGFWIKAGKVNPEARKVRQTIKTKKGGVFRTLSSHPETDNSKKVFNNALELIENGNNEILESFVCQGRLNNKFLIAISKLSKSLRDINDDEMIDSAESSKEHPNKEDLEEAKKIFKNFIDR